LCRGWLTAEFESDVEVKLRGWVCGEVKVLILVGDWGGHVAREDFCLLVVLIASSVSSFEKSQMFSARVPGVGFSGLMYDRNEN
jgi:hypothetical protein